MAQARWQPAEDAILGAVQQQKWPLVLSHDLGMWGAHPPPAVSHDAYSSSDPPEQHVSVFSMYTPLGQTGFWGAGEGGVLAMCDCVTKERRRAPLRFAARTCVGAGVPGVGAGGGAAQPVPFSGLVVRFTQFAGARGEHACTQPHTSSPGRNPFWLQQQPVPVSGLHDPFQEIHGWGLESPGTPLEQHVFVRGK